MSEKRQSPERQYFQGRTPEFCANCDSELVEYVGGTWRPFGGSNWQVDISCPNCEQVEVVVLDQASIDRFVSKLAKGRDDLVRDHRNLLYANMATEINVFMRAIDADNILPEDFAFTPNPKGDPLDDEFHLPHY